MQIVDDNTKWILESTIAPLERTIKRLWVLVILLIIICLGTNVGWWIYESQYQYVEASQIEQEIKQETDGGGDNSNVFIGGDSYGKTDN